MTEHWMADLGEKIAGRKLRELVLPASHDSGTYDIKAESQYSPDLAPWLKIFGKGAIATFARAQIMNVEQQLNAGYRVFDLRVAKRVDKSVDDFWIYHGMYSVKLAEVLNAVRDFSIRNPREIIMLLLSHFLDMVGNDGAKLVELLKTTFGNRLAQESLGVDATVLEFWNAGTPIILICDPGLPADKILWTPSSTFVVVDENYSEDNFHSANAVIDWLDKNAILRNYDKFWDLPLILTVNWTQAISWRLRGGLEGWTRKTAVRPFTDFYESQEQILNIIAVDYVNLYSLVNWAIERNALKPWSHTRRIELKGVLTSENPCACEYNNQLYCLFKGAGSGDMYCAVMGEDAAHWNGPWMVNLGKFKTDASPAVAVFNNQLYCLFKGAGSGDMYCAVMGEDAVHWNGPWMVNPPGGTPTTDRRPALAAFDGKLYAAWKGSKDIFIWFTSASLHNNPQGPQLEWSPQTRFVVPGRTTRCPALATYHGRLYNLRAGYPRFDENSIFYSYMPYGQSSASSFDERASKGLASSATA